MTKDILKGNKLIAHFMDENQLPNNTLPKYHTSWNIIMPVVEKIRNIDWNVGQRGEYEQSHELIMAKERLANYSILYVGVSDIWEAVIEFIKWYNNKTTIQP